MSHWVKLKTKLNDTELLKKALTRLGYQFQEGDNLSVTEYGTTEKAEILLDKSLGLSKQEDGTYAFVGDPYHCTTQNLRQFYGKLDNLTANVTTAYSTEQAIEEMESKGFYLTEENDQGDELELVFENPHI